MNSHSKAKIFFNSFKTVVLTVIFFMLIVIALVAFSSRFNLPGGFRAYSVLTGSMEPVIQTGSLIFTKTPSSTDQIKKNEVVTFEQPGYENKFITHRISQVVNANPGVVFRTKGDANPSEDPWLISYGRIKGVYLAHLPYAGSLLEFIKTPLGIVLFVVIPVTLIVIDELKNLISTLADIKIEKERRKRDREVNAHKYLWILLFPLIGLGVGQTKAIFFSNNTMLANNKLITAIFSPSPSVSPTATPSSDPSSTPTSSPTPSSTPSSSPSASPSLSPSPSVSASPSPSGTVIIIEGNGSGSNNSGEVNNSTNCQTNQENNTEVDINISSDSNSGGNNNSGNTGGDSNTNTGNTSSSVTVNVSGGSNSSNNCP